MADDLDPAAVERAARGLFLHEYPGSEGAWDAPGDFGKAGWRAKARAALAAARDGEAVDREALRRRALTDAYNALTDNPSPERVDEVLSAVWDTARGAAAPTVTTEQRQAVLMILHTAGVGPAAAVTDQVLDALGVEVREP